MIYRFRTSIHARPPGDIPITPLMLAGRSVDALQLSPTQQAIPMAVGFEEAGVRLGLLPRMFFEFDGAFVWVGEQDSVTWQLDGCLYDRDQHLVYVEVVGSCPPPLFDQLLSAFGWPANELIFQLPQHAAFLAEPEFRCYASRTPSY